MLTKYLVALLAFSFPQHTVGQSDLNGSWDCYLECPGGQLRFGLLFESNSSRLTSCYIINGDEKISIPSVDQKDGRTILNIDHYDSSIVFERAENKVNGTWKKRRGPDEWVEMSFYGTKGNTLSSGVAKPNPKRYSGRWQVKFASSEDPAVAIFKEKSGNSVDGTFLTTTGDYRFLYGFVVDDKLELSCFDGAHAFLFRATINDDDTLTGDFWSSNTWHEKWTAARNDDAQLPDAFQQTTLVKSQSIDDFEFPDLNGKSTSLNDPKFRAPARLIYVFGSWCPNCHDAAAYFKTLQSKYGEKDLSILGLAFELTGDFERDSKQVQKYLERHSVEYPVLIAGVSDKKMAGEKIPFLDKVRSYPTTIFLDSTNRVRAIHTGFTGPATGASYEELKHKFESVIDGLIKEN